MIANIFRDDSFETQMLDMVARCGPKLMKAGGGALSREYSDRCRSEGAKQWDNRAPWVRTTPDQRAHVLALARAGHMSEIEICRETGVKQSAVNKLIRNEGLTVPKARNTGGKAT